MKNLVILALVLFAGCASVKTQKTESYLDNAREAYEAGEKAFADKLYEEAVKNFEEVRSKYPYSKYSALSDLKLGDLYFEQDKWFEAADAYDFYLRFHPRHEQSAYASFRIAKSYVSAIPGNFFLFPKSYVKDQTATVEALSALERYMAQHPEDSFVEEAKKLRVDLRSQVALRDLHIADFYLKRQKIKGAKARLEYVSQNYSDTPEGVKALEKLDKLL